MRLHAHRTRLRVGTRAESADRILGGRWEESMVVRAGLISLRFFLFFPAGSFFPSAVPLLFLLQTGHWSHMGGCQEPTSSLSISLSPASPYLCSSVSSFSTQSAFCHCHLRFLPPTPSTHSPTSSTRGCFFLFFLSCIVCDHACMGHSSSFSTATVQSAHPHPRHSRFIRVSALSFLFFIHSSIYPNCSLLIIPSLHHP